MKLLSLYFVILVFCSILELLHASTIMEIQTFMDDVNDHTHRRLKRSPILKKLFRGRNGGNTNQNVYNYHQYQYNPQPGYRDQQYFGHPPLNNYYPPIQQQSSASASAGTIGSGNMQASFSSASASVGSSYVGGRLMSK
ncbi:hypothetical protein Fcan01_08439 [Folsomia candida]|uniref:Uncharacterized protein n=1 Tax=Folsomia candida TaxID=158441 RepID=A0A226EIN9_FOLCA|nr:hypothetical protein Fcan01_08439 [Folsomia candida]